MHAGILTGVSLGAIVSGLIGYQNEAGRPARPNADNHWGGTWQPRPDGADGRAAKDCRRFDGQEHRGLKERIDELTGLVENAMARR